MSFDGQARSAHLYCSDAFCLYYESSTKTVKALNGSGRSPQKLTIDHLKSQGVTGRTIPLTHLNSVTVPGAAAAWYDTVHTFGSGKVDFKTVMAPAIRLAEEGFVIPLHRSLLNDLNLFSQCRVPVSEIHSHAVSSSISARDTAESCRHS